jgi:sialic acid synthase SpsE/quercetin dioxygenase-like cupin family protein
MSELFDKPLFILEMANNHMGDEEHGLRIIREFGRVCRQYPYKFAVKLQYRHLDSLIHPDYVGRTDIKYIKRFSETRLSWESYQRFIAAIKAEGMLAMCTPFDEASVDFIVDGGFDILKIASCSCTDWPLLERAVLTDMPMVVSTAGVPSDQLDHVATFLRNRQKQFALMHCVAEYPTPLDKLELNQIDFLRARYPDLSIGYSTHESPDLTAPVGLAIAKGSRVFEKHVGIPTETYALNNYSATPEQIDRWLQAAADAFASCGTQEGRAEPTAAETESLFSLRRGVYLRRPVPAGHRITEADVFFALPTQPSQITANDWSKYSQFYATADLDVRQPALESTTRRVDTRDIMTDVVSRVKELLQKSNVVVPSRAQLEISHHYGLERVNEHGITMITVVNRAYCKKLIVVLPGQKHPTQFHKLKEETFHVLYGDLILELDGSSQTYGPGSSALVARGVHHSFESRTGAVFEEISSTHSTDDSFYLDPEIARNTQRKTYLNYWFN